MKSTGAKFCIIFLIFLAHLVLEGWFIIVRLTLQIFVETFI